MSIFVMSEVWKTNLEPNKKLVLLALADRADDDGMNSYPSVAKIAAKASLSERTVQRILSDFRDDGLIVLTDDYDPKKFRPNTYAIDLNKLAMLQNGKGVTQVSPGTVAGGDIGVTGGVTQVSPGGCHPCHPIHPSTSCTSNIDPLPTVVDSAGSRKLTKDQQREAHQREQQALADQAGISLRADVPLGVPAVQMVMAYHHYLPGLPKCVAITTDRAKKLSARWKDCGEDANSWKHVLVDKIAPSAFLTGRAQARPGAEPFKATIDWIIGPENFIKIIEGKYVHGQAPDYSNVR